VLRRRGPAQTERHVRFREVLTMPADGAEIALDWELPTTTTTTIAAESLPNTTNTTATAAATTATTAAATTAAATTAAAAAAAAAATTTTTTATTTASTTDEQKRIEQVLHGPICQPVVLILHGMNNHAGFGYMRSMMRECS
jgi:predicted alpha/beta-fold hydrolase